MGATRGRVTPVACESVDIRDNRAGERLRASKSVIACYYAVPTFRMLRT